MLNPQPSSQDEIFSEISQLRQDGMFLEAEALCRDLLQTYPDHHRALFSLGEILLAVGRLDEAEQACGRGLELATNSAEGLNAWGKIFQARQKVTDAERCFREAIALGIDVERSYSNLGNLFKSQFRLAEAEMCYRKSIEANPEFADAYNNLSVLQMLQGKAADAIENSRKALALNPTLSISHSNLLFSMNFAPECTSTEIFKESRLWDLHHGSGVNANPVRHDNDPDPARRLRVGYVSPDFRQHPVSYFFKPLLSAHDQDCVHVTCYSDVARPDPMTNFLQQISHCWRECSGLSHAALAEVIRKDKIDILVDLTGHTANSRLKVFAAKPAPVQVNWLGSPNTTGLSTIDYRLTDDIADPQPHADQFYTEKQYRLRDGFVCYSPPASAPDVSLLPASQVGFVTFGSFNTLAKITPQVLDLWAVLLQSVKSSHLLLKNMSFVDETTRKHYLSQLVSRGIDPARVKLCAPVSSTRDHLNFYRHIDICIDTFPFNGFTTSCEALWMGVPVVTLLGDRHGGRVSASFLTALGLERLVANTADEYIGIAAELAKDLNALAGLRRSMRKRFQKSSLFDAGAFAQKVEEAYRAMWREWCARQ